MIKLIIESYLSIFLAVGGGCITIFIFGIYLIFKMSKRDEAIQASFTHRHQPLPALQRTSDLSVIAGEDIVATQLDLARAYIEINQKPLAQTILESVLQQGNVAQQEEARHLLSYIG